MNVRRFPLAIFTGLFLFVGTARPYGKTWLGMNLEYAVREAHKKIGPFRLRMLLNLSDAGYDSNVYRTAANRIKDYSVTAGPAFYVYLPIKRTIIFSIYESPQYVYFFETKRERTWNNFLSGQMALTLRNVYLSAGAGLSNAREIWSTEIDIRPERRERVLNGDALWQIFPKASVQLGYREAELNYEELSARYPDVSGIGNISYELNRTERYLNVGAYRQAGGRARLGAEFELGRYEFKSAGNPRNSESRGLFGKWDFDPNGGISGRIRIGYKEFRLQRDAKPNFHGLVADSDLSVKIGRTIKLRAAFGRVVQFSTWFGYSYFVENRVGGGISFYISRKIRLDYDGFTERNFYPLASLTGVGRNDERTDDFLSHRVGIYFRIKDRTAIGIIWNWWRRDSTLGLINGQRDFFGANIIYNF